MTRLFLVRCLGVAALLTAIAWPLETSAQPPAPLARLELNAGDQIVFLGDSITHQCLYTQYVEDYFYTRHPGMRLKFHNAGVGGAKAWDALERFDRDVAQYQPRYVTVLLGMNDGRYQAYDEQILQTYVADMQQVIDRIKATGATPILMTPTMFDSRAARMQDREHPQDKLTFYNSVLAYFGTWLREVAVENGYGFVDMYSPLNNITLEQRKTDPEFTLIKDAVHPGADGQLVMAYAIIEHLGLRKPLSNIQIVMSPAGQLNSKSTGGELSDVTYENGQLSFSWHAAALPWVVPEEAQLGADLLKLGHRASREALEIHGLPAGRYEVVIDDQVVGTYSSEALSRHIELQGNASTPQYRQALSVVELNRERNAGPVRNLRNEWRAFQTFARARQQLTEQPENAALKKQVADLTARLEGLDERIRQHEAAALEIEDRIYEQNQPKARRYLVRPQARP